MVMMIMMSLTIFTMMMIIMIMLTILVIMMMMNAWSFQVDLRGVTEILFSEIHSVNLFLTKVLNWGSLTLIFRNINR